MKDKITIARGLKIPKGTEAKLKKKPGGSNVGKYKNISPSEFAGPSGGAPKGSFPINTMKHAKAALAYAHNAPKPSGIRAAVHKKFPDMGGKKMQKNTMKSKR